MSPGGFARVAIHPAASSSATNNDDAPPAAWEASAVELRPRLLVNASGLGALKLAGVGGFVGGG